MRGALQSMWLRLHRWVGLTLGVLLALVAATGAAMIVYKPIDRQLHPELFVASASGPTALDAARATLRQAFGAQARLTLRPPREASDTLWAYVDGDFHGVAYLEPSTGRLLGQREEHQGAANLLFALHSELLLGETGRSLLAVVALAYLALLASGLVLWWPAHWRQALAVKWGARPVRLVFDLHRVGGALLGLLILGSVASGVWMAWKPLPAWVNRLAAQPAAPAPIAAPVGGKPASLDAMAEAARRAFPGAPIGYVVVPPPGREAVRIRLKLANDPHPNGLTSVWFHPTRGDVLATQLWNDLPPGTRQTTWIYPLHSGQLGGNWHLALNALLGASLAAMAGSGVWLWWRRRPRRVRRAAPGSPSSSRELVQGPHP